MFKKSLLIGLLAAGAIITAPVAAATPGAGGEGGSSVSSVGTSGVNAGHDAGPARDHGLLGNLQNPYYRGRIHSFSDFLRALLDNGRV